MLSTRHHQASCGIQEVTSILQDSGPHIIIVPEQTKYGSIRLHLKPYMPTHKLQNESFHMELLTACKKTSKFLLKQDKAWDIHTEASEPLEGWIYNHCLSLCRRADQDNTQRIVNQDQCILLWQHYKWWSETVPVTIFFFKFCTQSLPTHMQRDCPQAKMMYREATHKIVTILPSSQHATNKIQWKIASCDNQIFHRLVCSASTALYPWQ